MRRAEDEAALRAATVDERGKTGVGFFFSPSRCIITVVALKG